MDARHSVSAPIFGKILVDRLLCFIYKFGILSKSQHCFLRKRGTTTAIYELTFGLFIDLSKAVDSVDHEKLLLKLFTYRVRDSRLNLFLSDLRNRIQRVCIDNGSDIETG